VVAVCEKANRSPNHQFDWQTDQFEDLSWPEARIEFLMKENSGIRFQMIVLNHNMCNSRVIQLEMKILARRE
jgi:hypothetical protein